MTNEKTHENCVHHRINAIFLHPTDREKCSINEWCEYKNDLSKDASKCKQFKHLRAIMEQSTLERFTVDSEGKYWDRVNHKYVSIDHLFRLVEQLDKENGELKHSIDVERERHKGTAKENEQLKQQMQTILKLTKKIEDCTHDIKLIGDV